MKRTMLHHLADGLHACRKFILAATVLTLAGQATVASAQTPFYDAPRSMLAGKPGSLVRQEVIDGAPLGATAYRVLYRSIGMKGVLVEYGPGGSSPAHIHARLPTSIARSNSIAGASSASCRWPSERSARRPSAVRAGGLRSARPW